MWRLRGLDLKQPGEVRLVLDRVGRGARGNAHQIRARIVRSSSERAHAECMHPPQLLPVETPAANDVIAAGQPFLVHPLITTELVCLVGRGPRPPATSACSRHDSNAGITPQATRRRTRNERANERATLARPHPPRRRAIPAPTPTKHPTSPRTPPASAHQLSRTRNPRPSSTGHTAQTATWRMNARVCDPR